MREYFKLLCCNEANKHRLGSAIVGARLPHALLLDGPDGSGKMTFAREIAAALNCLNKEKEHYPLPCGMCESCRKIRSDSFPDVRILHKAENKATIGVAEVAELKSDAYLSSTEAEYKVYIIDGAERMTPEAQNSLLIILEEPPKNVVLMLLSESSDKILTTIKSRCQYLPMERFSPVGLDELLTASSEAYKRLKASSPDKCGEITVLADGRLGKALELVRTGGAVGVGDDYSVAMKIAEAIAKKSSYTEIYSAISALSSKRAEVTLQLEMLMNALRDMTLSRTAESFTPLFFPSKEKARELADRLNLSKLGRIFDALSASHEAIFKNANVGAAMTVLTAKIKTII
jgi:DNA polymerase III delta' subunit